MFIRIIDRLFDVMNIRSPFGKGFTRPLFLYDYARWKIISEESITYLITLKTKAGTPLITYRRKTFLVGFIIAALGIKQLRYDLRTREEHPFKYVLTYKLSQDHRKLLFACIQGKSGFNNTPDVVQLNSSLRKILLRNSIIDSKQTKCLAFENNSAGSILSLKWNKRNAPLVEKDDHNQPSIQDITELSSKLDACHLLTYKEAILGYISIHKTCSIQRNVNNIVIHILKTISNEIQQDI